MEQSKLATAAITDILREIGDFDWNVYPPIEEACKEHDEVIGKCPEELRRFYSFSRFCERELKQLSVEVEFTSDKDAITAQIYQWRKKYEVAHTLLWFAARAYYNAWDPEYSIHMVKDWDVVEHKREQGSDMPPMIRRLLGF